MSADGRGPAPIVDRVDALRGLYTGPHGDPLALQSLPASDRSLQWIIPDFGPGSGGHTTIFRFVNGLAARGFEQRICILPPYKWHSAAEAKESAQDWFGKIDAVFSLGLDDMKPCHAVLATGHQTGFAAANFEGARHKLYFVQDYEPWFFPVSSQGALAEETYRLGMTAITAGPWIADKLKNEYGMSAHPFSFSADRSLYQPEPSRRGVSEKTVLFYARHGTPRRLVELGYLALEALHRMRGDVRVIFIGSEMAALQPPFPYEDKGNVAAQELPDLYRRSNIALVLSGTNLSLLPMELAACGCPVVMNDQPQSKWLLSEDEAFYAPLNPEKMAQTISDALSDEKQLSAKAAAALKRVHASSWDAEFDKVADVIKNLTTV